MKALNIMGPPGSGKTRTLVRLFVQLAGQVGPDKVAVVTYTRAAAEEFRVRAGRALGIAGDSSDLKREMPWVGTIHALAHKSLGRPKLLSDKQREAFCGSWLPEDLSADEVENVGNYDPVRLERAIALRLESLSNNWGMSMALFTAYATLSPEIAGLTSPSRIVAHVGEYHAYCRGLNVIDFDGLLMRCIDQDRRLPVRALLVDEAQDNSQLLWEVIGCWRRDTPVVVQAGDPWQALYQHVGANPELFLKQPGEWRVLAKSHRLDRPAAQYARRILKLAGWQDPKIDAWEGVGGYKQDGRTFYLARTRRMLKDVEKDLIRGGVPFRRFDGGSPLETRAADACRTWLRLLRGEAVPATLIQQAIRANRDPYLQTRAALMDAYAGDDVTDEQLNVVLGRAGAFAWGTPWWDYVKAISDQHGPAAVDDPPSTILGTIHSAKGREADKVFLVRSWGREPYKALETPQGRLQEACVAYVGSTRHRTHLTLIDGGYGGDYPFPNQHAYAQLEET